MKPKDWRKHDLVKSKTTAEIVEFNHFNKTNETFTGWVYLSQVRPAGLMVKTWVTSRFQFHQPSGS